MPRGDLWGKRCAERRKRAVYALPTIACDVIATKNLATLIAQSFGGIDTDRI